MPAIKTLDVSPDIGLRPTETGVEAVAGAARRGGAFFNQAAESISSVGRDANSAINAAGEVAVKYEDHREISAGAANGAQRVAELNDQWNKIAKNADPNDPTTAAKFREEVLEPALQKFKEGFNTERSQAWAERFVDNYRTHMFEKTASDMSSLAGIAVKVNYEKTKNLLSSAVAADPSSLDFALKSVDHSVGAMADSSPNLDATQSAKVRNELTQSAKQEIVKAAVSGMITKNPNVDLDAIQKKYGEYINGAEMKMFAKAAQTQAKVDAARDRQDLVTQKQLADMNVHKSAGKLLTDSVSIDPQTSRPVIDPKYFNRALDIARNNPDAPSAASTARTLIDWGEHQQNLKAQPLVSDPVAKQDLTDRLFSADRPTTTMDLMRAQVAGKLSDHDFTVMHRLVTELETTPLKAPIWTSTAAAVKDALIVTLPGIPGKDSKGTEAYSSFMQAFLPDYIAKSRAGTLPPNALDVKDPNSMISQAMAPFKRSPAQRMQDYVSSVGGLGAAPSTPAPAARKVGDVPVPAALGGIAALQYNAEKKQWRDQTSGTVYDSAGKPVAR